MGIIDNPHHRALFEEGASKELILLHPLLQYAFAFLRFQIITKLLLHLLEPASLCDMVLLAQ